LLVLVSTKTPRPALGGVDERRWRVAAEIRIDGQRVTCSGAAVDTRGVGGVLDVAALGVENHRQPGASRVEHDVFQDPDAPPAEPLEKRALRLDHRDVRRQTR
jgi:hypothetical protein